MASKVVSMRFAPEQIERLQRVARRMGRTGSEVAALFVEESMRRTEFAFVDFRDSAAGRRACITGSSLAVWEVIMVARSYEMDAAKTAEHLQWPIVKVKAAFNYFEAFREEVQADLDENDSYDFEKAKRLLPSIQLFEFKAE